MSGGPTTTTNSSEKFDSDNSSYSKTGIKTNPYEPSLGLIGDYLGRLGGYDTPTEFSPTENAAFEGIKSSSQYGIPELQNLTQGLLGGYGFGEGREGIDNSWNTLQSALTPYASGDFLNLESNPYTSQIIGQITDSARNNVSDMFSRAGREFSGAHAGALAKATTEGLAPTLFNQFNLQQGNQMNAANALLQGGLNRSQGLDASASGRLGAGLAAPGVIGQIGSQLASPYQTTLQQFAAERGLPYESLSQLSNLLLPIASQFGTKDILSASKGSSSGKSSGTSTSSTASDPLQTGIGAAIGLLGLL